MENVHALSGSHLCIYSSAGWTKIERQRQYSKEHRKNACEERGPTYRIPKTTVQ